MKLESKDLTRGRTDNSSDIFFLVAVNFDPWPMNVTHIGSSWISSMLNIYVKRLKGHFIRKLSGHTDTCRHSGSIALPGPPKCSIMRYS